VRQRLSCLAIVACFATADALALPVGAQVVNGAASIAQTGNVLTVTNSNGAIINWQQFNIDAGQTARFVQPSASSSVLNRVLANDPSVIFGNLTSNGKVWLVNPAGIFVGPGARIDVAAFVSSTLNVTNRDFLANRLRFEASPGAGNVVNQGTITTPMGGSVYLVGSNVSNEGIITTPRGETILAAGTKVELIDSATPGVKVEIAGAAGNATNLGEITAEAGRIGIAGVVVRNSGRLNASSVVVEGGRIFLRATKKIDLTDSSRVGADGTAGGNITAITSENGQISGELVARGEISAQGNGQAGSGGFVETSAARLDIDHVAVATRGGEWLLDPNDIMIQAIGPDANVSGDPNFSSTADSSIITTGTIQNALNGGTSVIITTGAGGSNSQPGNITVADAIAKTAGTDATLTLNAHNNINLNAGIGSTAGLLNMVFNANSDATGGGTVNLGTMTLNANGGSISIPGIAFISSGTATLDSATTIGSLNVAGGTLTGAGNITVPTGGAFAWSGGALGGSGLFATQAGVTSTLTGGTKTLSRPWSNAGTATWTVGGCCVGLVVNSTLDNSGVFDIQVNNSFTNITGTGTINNSGTFQKTTVAGTSEVAPSFNNLAGGVVNVNSGTLLFQGGGTDAASATYNVASGATLRFDGGTRTIDSGISGAGSLYIGGGVISFAGTVANTLSAQVANGTVNVDGAGFAPSVIALSAGTLNINQNISAATLTQSSGTLAGTGNLTLTGSGAGKSNWTGGTMGGSGTLYVAAGAELELASGFKVLADTRVIDNAGTINWTGGQLRFSQGTGATRVDNHGLLDIKADIPERDRWLGQSVRLDLGDGQWCVRPDRNPDYRRRHHRHQHHQPWRFAGECGSQWRYAFSECAADRGQSHPRQRFPDQRRHGECHQFVHLERRYAEWCGDRHRQSGCNRQRRRRQPGRRDLGQPGHVQLELRHSLVQQQHPDQRRYLQLACGRHRPAHRWQPGHQQFRHIQFQSGGEYLQRSAVQQPGGGDAQHPGQYS